jgi:hypothetical protein
MIIRYGNYYDLQHALFSVSMACSNPEKASKSCTNIAETIKKIAVGFPFDQQSAN